MPVRHFDPNEADAALKICVDALLLDKRFDDLAYLLSKETKVDELQGDPGWSLEMRKSNNSLNIPWPHNADVRASVDPDIFRLSHPDFFCTSKELRDFIKSRIESSPEINETAPYKSSKLFVMMK